MRTVLCGLWNCARCISRQHSCLYGFRIKINTQRVKDKHAVYIINTVNTQQCSDVHGLKRRGRICTRARVGSASGVVGRVAPLGGTHPLQQWPRAPPGQRVGPRRRGRISEWAIWLEEPDLGCRRAPGHRGGPWRRGGRHVWLEPDLGRGRVLPFARERLVAQHVPERPYVHSRRRQLPISSREEAVILGRAVPGLPVTPVHPLQVGPHLRTVVARCQTSRMIGR